MTGTPLHKVISGLNRWLEQGVSKDAEVVYCPPAFGLEGGLCTSTDKDIASIDIPPAPTHGDLNQPHTVRPGTASCPECGTGVPDFKPGEFYKVPWDNDATVWFAVLPHGGAMPIKTPPE